MIDSDTIARALVATFDDRRVSAYSCAGIDADNPPDELPHMDSDESENYGAAVTWDEAAEALRTAFMLGDGIGGAVGSSDLLRLALLALDGLVQLEGPGSDLHDAAEGCAAMLRSVDGSPAFPVDLLYLAGQAVAEACSQSAAAASAIVTMPAESTTFDVQVRLAGLETVLKATAHSSTIR